MLLISVSSLWVGYEMGSRQSSPNGVLPLRGGPGSPQDPSPTPSPKGTTTESSTGSPTDACSQSLLHEPWHLEATSGAAEDSSSITDPNILSGTDTLRVTYNLHGLTAREGPRQDASAIVFDQPNWYVVSLENYGANGLDAEQTVYIPLTDFISLPDPPSGTPGGKRLALDKAVYTVHARFWHDGPFVVDITDISLCGSRQ